mmetsp:Transcript_23274/g.77260  ORF Transcript_23274/g.77260 Transcript_23274/m.77260 type:complete len:262 (-) Transcript_23274:216-1001(-)
MRRHRRPYGRGRHRSGLSALRMPPLRPTPLRRRFPAVFARGPRRGRHGGASCRRGSDADRCWVCTARHARRGLPPPGSEPLVAPRAAPLRRPAQPPPRGACRGAAARRVPRARLASHAPLRFHPKRLAKDAALALMRRLPLRYRPVWRAQVGVRRCRLQALPRLRAARHRPAAGGVAQPLHRLARRARAGPLWAPVPHPALWQRPRLLSPRHRAGLSPARSTGASREAVGATRTRSRATRTRCLLWYRQCLPKPPTERALL